MAARTLPNHRRCTWCGKSRGLIVMDTDHQRVPPEQAVAVCPSCDYVGGNAGPWVERRVKDQ